jgi:hypothetical protein
MKTLNLDKLALLGGVILMAVFPAFAGETCLTRYYDAEHLGQHPDQLVTGVTLLLKTQSAADKDVPERVGSFQIALTQRGSNKLYVQEGDLLKDGAGYTGQVECDGGGFALHPRDTGALMSLGRPNGGKYLRVAVVPDPCGESDQSITQSTTIVPGTDDAAFLLNATPLQVCTRVLGRIDWDAVGQTNE